MGLNLKKAFDTFLDKGDIYDKMARNTVFTVEWFELGLVMFIKRDILWKSDVEKFADDKNITRGSQKWK